MTTGNPKPATRTPGGGIAPAYDNSALLDLVGREQGKVAVLVGGGPSGERWRELTGRPKLSTSKRDDFVVVTVNGCCQDWKLRACTDYSLMLECDPPLPHWQWTPQPGSVVVMNEYLRQPDWWGYEEAVHKLAMFASRAYAHNAADRSCRELVLARRNNGPHGPLPPAGQPWPPAETDPRAIAHGLHIGPDVGVPGVPPLGTSLVPALHLCFALGCRTVHSVGFDLCAREESREQKAESRQAPAGDGEQRDPDGLAGRSARPSSAERDGRTHRQHWYEEPRYGEDPRKPKWEWREKLGLVTSEWWYQSALYAVGLRERWSRLGCHWTDHTDGLLQRVQENWHAREAFNGALRSKYGLEHEAAHWFMSRDGVREHAARLDWGMEQKPEVKK